MSEARKGAQGRPVRMSDVCEVAGVSPPTVTARVEELIEDLSLPLYKHKRTGRWIVADRE